MTGKDTRRWFAAIPRAMRFYIMLAILVIAEVALVAGCLHAMRLQTEASAELARAAAVQRSLDRALISPHGLPRSGRQPSLTSISPQLSLKGALHVPGSATSPAA